MGGEVKPPQGIRTYCAVESRRARYFLGSEPLLVKSTLFFANVLAASFSSFHVFILLKST